MSSILHGTEVIYLSNNYLADLQIEENKALRYTVNARRKTAISANLVYLYKLQET